MHTNYSKSRWMALLLAINHIENYKLSHKIQNTDVKSNALTKYINEVAPQIEKTLSNK